MTSHSQDPEPAECHGDYCPICGVKYKPCEKIILVKRIASIPDIFGGTAYLDIPVTFHICPNCGGLHR